MRKPARQLDRLVFNSGINPEDLGDLPSGVPGYTLWVNNIHWTWQSGSNAYFLATSQVDVIIKEVFLLLLFLPLEVLLCGQLSSSAHITNKTTSCSRGWWTFRVHIRTADVSCGPTPPPSGYLADCMCNKLPQRKKCRKVHVNVLEVEEKTSPRVRFSPTLSVFV